MNNFIILEYCEDGSCCCLTARSAVVFISVISLFASLIEVLLNDSYKHCRETIRQVESLRSTLVTFFQMANILLLLGCILENASLLQIYLWYAIGFILLGFVMSMVDFLFRHKVEGVWSFINFITEVAFLFVTFRCLALVDLYRKHIETL